MNNTMPKVRFDGFSGAWNELKMGEVFEQTNEYINPQESDIELFSLTVEKGLTQKTARYNREFLVKKADKFKKVCPNEFVYNPMNMTLGAVGFNDFKSSVAVSGYYVTMKIKQNFNNEYFRIVLTSPQAIHLYKLYATGSLIEKQRVQFPTFSEIRVKVPPLEEQQKIGTFFKQLDDTIALQQQLVEQQQHYKKAMLQKMFPQTGERVPEVRFEGFSGYWDNYVLNDVAKYRRGSFPQPYGNKEWFDEVNGMPFVQVVDVKDNLKLAGSTKQKISVLAQPKSVFVDTDTLIVTLQGSIGRVAITQYPSYVDRTILIFEEYKLPVDLYYFAYIIQKLFEKEKEKAPGGTIKTITKEALSSFVVSIPTFEEQQRIGTFFKQLDDTISLHKKKLEDYHQLKKALLQRMFV